MAQYGRDKAYQDKDAVPCAFEHLGQSIEIVMTVYVPEKFRVSGSQTLMKHYAPLDSILGSFIRKALKAVTLIDFRTYFVMNLPLWSFMSP